MEINGAKLSCYNPPRPLTFERSHCNADEFLFGLHSGAGREATATKFAGVTETYHELDKRIDKIARALHAYGIEPGDHVSMAMPNLPESVAYIYACWRIGAVANLIDPRTNSEGILERVKMTNSKLFVTVFNVCEPKMDDILDELPQAILVSPADSLKGNQGAIPALGLSLAMKIMKKKFIKSHQTQLNSGKYIWHVDFIKKYHATYDIRAAYRPNMPAVVVYTSGTSADGLIKGAVMTHEALNAAPIGFYFSNSEESYEPGDTFGGFIPFFTAYGATAGMHTSLCGGLVLILVPLFDTTKFAKMLLNPWRKPNTFLGVPRFHEQLADHPKLQKKSKKLGFIKNAVSGGDKISMASLERVNAVYMRNGAQSGLRIGYGSTELGGSISVMPAYDPAVTGFPWREEGNVGYILPQCRAVVIDPEHGEQLPIGEVGELCMHSLCQMEEYYGMPKETAEITWIHPDGTKFYRMGDKGRLDESGIFYFIDRYKRSLMRPDGHTVHPAPIENVIMQHQAVDKCAVAGLAKADGSAGTITCAFVILREGFGGNEEAERKLILEMDQLTIKKLPERDRAMAFRIVKELPYNNMSKVNFRELEKEVFDPAAFVITDFTFFPDMEGKIFVKTMG